MLIKYKLESINEVEYRFNYDFDYKSLDPGMIDVRVGQEMRPYVEDERVAVSAKAEVVDSSTGIVLVTNVILMTFGLSPIKDIISFDSEGNVKTQDTMILDTFIVAAVGALRGVLMKNLKGTPLSFVSIPLIPLDELRPRE